jgi:phage terminase large subunit GpA-like protein
MSSNREKFEAWYVRVLENLYDNRDAGIAVLIVSLPLMERYLRRKYRLASDADMTVTAMDGLRALFPALGTADQARKFWSVRKLPGQADTSKVEFLAC